MSTPRSFYPLAGHLARSNRRRLRGVGGERLYYAHGWTDSDIYQGPSGGGRGIVGTVRMLAYVISMPTAGVQKIIAGRISAPQEGWRLQTGLGGLSTISAVMGGSLSGWDISPLYTIQAGDVGKLLLVHAWADAAGVHLAVGGSEVGAGSGTIIVVTDPGAGSLLTLGRYQHAPGFGNPHIGIVALSASPTVMTLTQIADDADAVMSSSSRLVLPDMPGEDMRFVAADALAGPWPDRIGNDCTLTETGSITVTEVP